MRTLNFGQATPLHPWMIHVIIKMATCNDQRSTVLVSLCLIQGRQIFLCIDDIEEGPFFHTLTVPTECIKAVLPISDNSFSLCPLRETIDVLKLFV